MSYVDKKKWEKKYTQTPNLLEDRSPSRKLEVILPLLEGKNVLDVACGGGRNSIYLAKNGFNIDAYDISEIALNSLNSKGYNSIYTKQIDLDTFTPTPEKYDLIVKTNFLDLDLIPKLLSSLKPKGILFVETYMDHPSNTKPKSNSKFLLQKEELKTFVSDQYQLIEYDEFDNEQEEQFRMKKQSIILQSL